MGQIGPEWENKHGTFSDQISDKIYWNLIWKSPGFVPFRANLTHFGAKPDIGVMIVELLDLLDW